MIPSRAVNAAEEKEAMLPRRDWILLPAIGLLTIGLLAGSTEFLARRMFYESKTGVASCMVLNDPTTGARGIANAVCRGKAPESEWTEYRFNHCGHRAGMECAPKQPGVYRIVMIGSSVAMGEYVQREKTFAALLPSELARLTGRKVELYNEGMGWGFSHSTTLRFKDALQAQPDLILWVLTHEDVARAPVVLPTADLDPNAGVSFSAKAWLRAHDIFAGKSIMDGVAGVFGHTRTALLLRHFLYRSQSQYVKSYLLGSNAGFLRTELDAGWKARLKEFDGDATEIEGRSKMAGVPFAAVFVPIHSQAAMVSAGAWPPGYDPYTLDNAMRAIIVSHGGTYLDILPDFRSIPDPGRYYMPVDGHPNAQGHAVYTVLIAKELASGAIPALRAAVQPQGAPERAK